jgi:seryl-tRNA synthetase
MTLDLDLLRAEKGGNPEKLKENARRRFDDPGAVDKVVKSDEEWRKGEKRTRNEARQLSNASSPFQPVTWPTTGTS